MRFVSHQGAAPEQEPKEHPSLWDYKIKTWMERYEEASSNQYSEDVQVLLRVKEQGDGKSLAYNTHPASFKPPVEVHLFIQFLWKVIKISLFSLFC